MNGKSVKYGVLALALVAILAIGGLFTINTVASAQEPTPEPTQSAAPALPCVRLRLFAGGVMGMGGRLGGGGGSLLTSAAATLGMTQADLVTALSEGKSVADVAQEKGVDVARIVEAYLATRAESVRQAVAAGLLTQAQADAQTALVKANAEAWLAQKFTATTAAGPCGLQGMPFGFGREGAPFGPGGMRGGRR